MSGGSSSERLRGRTLKVTVWPSCLYPFSGLLKTVCQLRQFQKQDAHKTRILGFWPKECSLAFFTEKIFHSIQAIYQMHYLSPKSEWTWKKTEWFDANSLSLLRKMTSNPMYFLKLTYSSIYYVNKQHESLWFEKTTIFISSQFCEWETWRAPQWGRSSAGITWAHCSQLAPRLGQEASLAAGSPPAAGWGTWILSIVASPVY